MLMWFLNKYCDAFYLSASGPDKERPHPGLIQYPNKNAPAIRGIFIWWPVQALRTSSSISGCLFSSRNSFIVDGCGWVMPRSYSLKALTPPPKILLAAVWVRCSFLRVDLMKVLVCSLCKATRSCSACMCACELASSVNSISPHAGQCQPATAGTTVDRFL